MVVEAASFALGSGYLSCAESRSGDFVDRQLPADYQEKVQDMILRAAFLLSTYMIPPEIL